MGAFIGYGCVGVWANNRERDAFLDWFAAQRCRPDDPRWEYCKSGAQRWTGRCIELGDLIPRGEVFAVSEDERADCAVEFWPNVAQLLEIIAQITRGEWKHSVDSKEAKDWRKG
jgi:hypothetical protein